MTDEKKTLTLSGKTLSLGNKVRPTNGYGRSNAVRVEVRKKRFVQTEQKPTLLTQDATAKLKLVQQAQRAAEQARQEDETRRQ